MAERTNGGRFPNAPVAGNVEPLTGIVEAHAQLVSAPGFGPLGLGATAGSLGQYAEKKLLDLLFGGTAWGAIAGTLYLALLSDTNTDAQRAAGTYTELANANAYARTAIVNNATNWPAATAGSPASKSNGVAITPPTPTGALWVQINGILITDSATIGAGNIYATASLTVPIAAGATAVSFPIGGLVWTLN